MRHDLRTLYNDFLHTAMAAVKRQDRSAALYCLSQALRCANTVKDDRNYKRKVMRAMNYVRGI